MEEMFQEIAKGIAEEMKQKMMGNMGMPCTSSSRRKGPEPDEVLRLMDSLMSEALQLVAQMEGHTDALLELLGEGKLSAAEFQQKMVDLRKSQQEKFEKLRARARWKIHYVFGEDETKE